MSEAMRIEGVSVRLGGRLVLRDLDLCVRAGERVGITGDNGAGKTTLLRVAAGLLRPEGGRVEVCGGPPGDPAARARVGLLGHAPSLYARLTAQENLRLWGRLYGLADPQARAAGLLRRLGLDPADPRPVAAYSQGMRQRVGLARALLHRPQLLLLDEPVAGLDAGGVEAMEALLGAEAQTVVVTTHHPEWVAGFCSRVLRLRGGRLEDA